MQTRRRLRALIPSTVLVVGVLLALLVSGAWQPITSDVGQQAGEAGVVAPDGMPRLAFVTRGDDLIDAPTVTAVAGQLDAIVVLSTIDRLATESAAALEEFDPGLVVLVGGADALAPAVEADVAALGFATRRVAGTSRFDTGRELVAFLEAERDASLAAAEPGEPASSELAASETAAAAPPDDPDEEPAIEAPPATTVPPAPAAITDPAPPASGVPPLSPVSTTVASIGGIGDAPQAIVALPFTVPDACGDGSTRYDLRVEASYFVQNDAASDRPGAAGDSGLYRAAVGLDVGSITPGNGGLQVTDVEVRDGARYADSGYESVAHDLVVQGVGPGSHQVYLMAQALDSDFLMRAGEITVVVTSLAGRCG